MAEFSKLQVGDRVDADFGGRWYIPLTLLRVGDGVVDVRHPTRGVCTIIRSRAVYHPTRKELEERKAIVRRSRSCPELRKTIGLTEMHVAEPYSQAPTRHHVSS